jgi:aspartate/methionine/tyrosine aminotransferase
VRFSTRVPADLNQNRLARAVDAVRASGRSYIDLTESNPTRVGLSYPDDLLAPLAQPAALRYSPSPFGLADARAAVADDYRRQGLDVPVDRIILSASTSESYSMLFKLLADPGDDVLIPRPSYPLFDHLLRLEGVSTRTYDLDYHGVWSIDLASVEHAITSRTRSIVVVAPNNPTGSFATRDEIDRLAGIAAGSGLAIIVDEVFADYELEAGAARRAGRVVAGNRALSFALGGLSKSIGLPQAKLGWMAAAGPPVLVTEALRRLEIICDTYLSVSTPVQLAARTLFERGAPIRHAITRRVAANYAALQAAAAAVPACRALRSEAGWYAVVQVPAVEPEEDLAIHLLTNEGVLTHPGYFFDFPHEAFVIVSLLPEPEAFADGIARLLRHFACTVPPQ